MTDSIPNTILATAKSISSQHDIPQQQQVEPYVATVTAVTHNGKVLLTIDDYFEAAKDKLQKQTYEYYASGAEDEITLRENREAFTRWLFRPRVLVGVQHQNVSTSILGDYVSFPVMIAPTAMHKLAHPDGELATAQAAAAMHTIYCLSCLSTTSMELIASAFPGRPRWFQLYVLKDRTFTQQLVRHAEELGFRALVVTVDAPRLGRRWCDVRNGFGLPPHIDLEILGGILRGGHTGESGLAAYFAAQVDDSLSWKDIAWLVSITKLPVIVKGISAGEDAALAVQHGCRGVVVSNHGGRQLDSALSSLECLEDVVNHVHGRCEVFLDGGVRRGSDVFKALALGARAVLIGRPALWGLATRGADGVHHVLHILHEELRQVMALNGCTTIADINRSYLRRAGAYPPQ